MHKGGYNMKQRNTQKLLLTLVIAGIVMIAGFIMIPRDFEKILDAGQEISYISCSTNETGIETVGTDVMPYIDTYTFNRISKEDIHFEKIMDILEDTQYRMSLYNLLPWDITSLSSDGEEPSILFWFELENGESMTFTFMGKSVWVQSEEIYKIVDSDALYELAAYIKANGEKQE